MFKAEGFLIPAPAIVDSPQTRHALLEHCGLDQIFQMAEVCNVALLSCGGIDTLTTSYRVGYVSEAERQSMIETSPRDLASESNRLIMIRLTLSVSATSDCVIPST